MKTFYSLLLVICVLLLIDCARVNAGVNQNVTCAEKSQQAKQNTANKPVVPVASGSEDLLKAMPFSTLVQ